MVIYLIKNQLGMLFHLVTVKSFSNSSTKHMRMKGNQTHAYCMTSLVKSHL